MKKKPFIRIAVTIIFFSFAWIILTPIFFPAAQAESETAAPHPGFMAPDFTLSTYQGETISLSDFQGQPVLVFLWASWCSVCKATMPGLQVVYENYSDSVFTILAVNTTFQDTLPIALDYFQSQGYTYTMLLDTDGEVARDYQLHALPTAVLVGPDGIVQDVVIGSGMSAGFLRSRLDDLLAERD